MSSHRLNSINSLSAPLSVWWDVTSKCNLSCLHCYSRSSQAKSNEDELSNSEAKALIRELSAMKVFGLYFLGGEPFMRPDFLDLLEYSVDRQLGVTISSNGWLITNSVARKLKSIGVSQVRISIDGATPETHDWQRNTAGSFHKAVEAVGNLIKNGIESVSIVSTISRGNASETAELIDLAAKLKVQAHQILVVTQSGRG
ncbi:MAG: radical SAM protein, partial [Bacteroidales bacterium]|nr:radical SAM protein [Bacteroidales bacterium]